MRFALLHGTTESTRTAAYSIRWASGPHVIYYRQATDTNVNNSLSHFPTARWLAACHRVFYSHSSWPHRTHTYADCAERMRSIFVFFSFSSIRSICLLDRVAGSLLAFLILFFAVVYSPLYSHLIPTTKPPFHQHPAHNNNNNNTFLNLISQPAHIFRAANVPAIHGAPLHRLAQMRKRWINTWSPIMCELWVCAAFVENADSECVVRRNNRRRRRRRPRTENKKRKGIYLASASSSFFIPEQRKLSKIHHWQEPCGCGIQPCATTRIWNCCVSFPIQAATIRSPVFTSCQKPERIRFK